MIYGLTEREIKILKVISAHSIYTSKTIAEVFLQLNKSYDKTLRAVDWASMFNIDIFEAAREILL